MREAKENECLKLRKENYSLQEQNREVVESNQRLEGENRQLRKDLDEIIGNKQILQAEQVKAVDYNI